MIGIIQAIMSFIYAQLKNYIILVKRIITWVFAQFKNPVAWVIVILIGVVIFSGKLPLGEIFSGSSLDYDVKVGDINFKGIDWEVWEHRGLTSTTYGEESQYRPVVYADKNAITINIEAGVSQATSGSVYSAVAIKSKNRDFTQYKTIKISASGETDLTVSAQFTSTHYFYKITIGETPFSIFEKTTKPYYDTTLHYTHSGIVSIEKQGDTNTYKVYYTTNVKEYLGEVNLKPTDNIVIMIGNSGNGQGSFSGSSRSSTKILDIELDQLPIDQLTEEQKENIITQEENGGVIVSLPEYENGYETEKAGYSDKEKNIFAKVWDWFINTLIFWK